MQRPTLCAIGSIFTASFGLFALGCSGAGAPSEAVEASSAQALVSRPAARLILTDDVLKRLQARAAAGDAAWTELKQKCDGYAGGSMTAPNGAAYPDFPNVGQGYQGEDYLPVIRALGLCYRTSTDAAAQARYGAAGGRLLDAMSTPVGSGGQSPATDAGYGIRNYVVGMAFGFDWLYPALSASTKTRVVASIDTWIDWYDQSGFINNDPIGNYFAGYFLAKTAAALATDGDNAKASTYWSDVTTRMWGKLVKPQFGSMLAGGGWPEGWGYGKKAVLSMTEALWAAKTALNLDWWKEVPLAHDEAAYAMSFSWPSLKHLDDRGTIRSGTNIRPSTELFTGLASMLEAMGDSSSGDARGFAADVSSVAGDDRAPWSKFLYGDPGKSLGDYKSGALSHFAAGPNHVGMRSAWDKTAVWGGFSAGAYINAAYSGEELFDAGSLSIVVGDQPLLINPTGWLPQNAGTAGEDAVYDDSYGKKQRRLYNSFFVDDSSNPYNPGQNSLDPQSSHAHIERYEDRAGFVHARGSGLGDQYGSSGSHPVSQFTRDLVYVRPGTFVLFDRTTVAQGSADQWLAFHTPVAPTQGTAADASQRRFDVNVGGALVGSLRSLLPKNASATTTSLPAAAARLEIHAPARSASQQWLSVVTAGTTGEQTRLSAADGNVTSGNMLGVELAAPQNQVVLFSADQAATGTVTAVDYSVSQVAATHVLVDVAPSASGYSVTATAASGKWRIHVAPGGSLQASTLGTLCFSVSATGTVSAPALPASNPNSNPGPSPSPSPDPSPSPSPDPIPTPTPTPGGAQQTLSLTQGVNGYSGVSDVSISNLYYSSANNPTGTVYRTNDMLYTYALDYTTKALIRFDVSQIPSTASVVSAKLDVTVESWTSPQTLIGNFLATPWSYASASLGWTSGGAGSWKTAGIGASDVTGPAFTFFGINASGYQRKTVALDPASVTAWLQSSTANQGIVLANQDPGKVLRIYSSEASDPAKRPTLSVSYQ
jgi:hypothetical protein